MPHPTRIALVTGSDDAYAPLALELIRSIRALMPHDPARRYDVNVISLGLGEEAGARLRAEADRWAEGRWDIALPEHRRRGRGWLVGRVAKLFPPSYFPGYDVYVWLDADAWIADWSAIELLVEGAQRGALAAVVDEAEPERISGSLKWWLGRIPWYRSIAYKHGRRAGLPTAELRRLFDKKEFNSGVYALAADAPHWAAIQGHMARLLRRGRVFGSNQLALTMAVHLDGLPVECLPLRCNFTGLPKLCAESGRLVMPYLPHEPVGILHLAGRDALRDDRQAGVDLTDTQGRPVRLNLRYDPRFHGETGAPEAVRA